MANFHNLAHVLCALGEDYEGGCEGSGEGDQLVLEQDLRSPRLGLRAFEGRKARSSYLAASMLEGEMYC